VGSHRLNGRTLSGSHSSDVGQGVIGGDRHLAAQRIHFPGYMPLRRPADGAIAGKVSNAVEPHGDASRSPSDARTREGRLDSGVPGTHNHDIELVHD
jgi:hypothetical protein